MKQMKLVLKAVLFCLAATLSMGVAQATTNLLYNYSFELPGTGKINTGFDTVPGWFSRNLTPPTTSDSGIQPGEVPPDGAYDGYTLESDGYHVRQTTSHVIQQGKCFLVSVWSKNEFVHDSGWNPTDGYLTMVLYYGGTPDVVLGGTNATLGTVGTPFFTNTFHILPGQGQHTVATDWTNYLCGVITNVVPTNAIGNVLGLDMWQSSAEFNPNTDPTKAWLDFDAPSIVGTNGIPPIATPVTLSPTNSVYGGQTLTFNENCFGSLPLVYQWQTDGGTNITVGTLTNIDLATNASLVVVTPTNVGTYNYVVIVTNSYGSVTSAVMSYFVRGLVPPFVTQNAGTADFGVITNILAFLNGNVNLYATVDGAPIVTNQWDVNTGGGYTAIAGATNFLRVLNVQPSSTGYYLLGATNAYGSTNSTSTHVTPLADSGPPAPTNMYAYCVYTNHPWAYWRFEETNDTLLQSMQAYDYSGNNFDATYGNSSGVAGSGCKDGGESILQNQHGPGPATYPGLESTNGCAGMANALPNGYLTVPSLNMNTNTVTFTMWIYPNSDLISQNTGLLMWRNGADAAGVGFGTGSDVNTATGRNMAELGYSWNTNSATVHDWHSGLYPVGGIWSFAAWVMSPNNTTIYLYYVNGGKTNLLKQVAPFANGPESFSGGKIWMGSDNYSDANTFDGYIDEVAVFTNAMSETQVQGLFLRALGLTNGIAPNISTPPTNTTVYQGQPLQMTVAAGGIPSPTYQWQSGTNSIPGNYTSPINLLGNAVDTTGGVNHGLYGSQTATVTYSNFNSAANALRVIAINAYGKATSSWARVTVLPVPTNGLWTVNFSVISTNNGGLGLPYVGHGILGWKGVLGVAPATIGGTYWNALTGTKLTSTTGLLDDGVTASGISFGSVNNLGSFSSLATGYTNNLLLDTFAQIYGNQSFVFHNVPNGKYNLALYGCVGYWVNRGITFTVDGVSQSITNVQDSFFLPDNMVLYTNLVVIGGSLEVDMVNVPSTPGNPTSTEGDFNGAQLQLVKYGPSPLALSPNNTTLTWSNGGLMQATNIMGPWVTNTATSPFTITPTGQMKFYRVFNGSF